MHSFTFLNYEAKENDPGLPKLGFSMVKSLNNDIMSTTYVDVEWKITQVEEKVSYHTRFLTDLAAWDEVFDLINEVWEDFKTVRYPSLAERDIAWHKFYALRQKAFDTREQDFRSISNTHRKELLDMLSGLNFDLFRHVVLAVVTLRDINEAKNEMRERGVELNKARKHFSSLKKKMTREDKTEVDERILNIQESHDQFWQEIKDRENEAQHIQNEKNKAWEEKQEKSREAKKRIEENIENNREKLEKAEETLERFEKTKESLEDKIGSAYSDSFRERHEEWLEELLPKIKSVEEQISRLKKWINEGQYKLSNWNT